MWTEFVLVFFIGFIFLYFPGILLVRCLQRGWFVSFIFAPAISLFSYFTLALIYSLVGVSSNWVKLFFPSLIFFAVIYFVISKVKKADYVVISLKEATLRDWLILFAGVFISLMIVILVFVKNLDGPSSFVQEFDNTTHLTVLKVFLETGDYSLLNFSKYILGDITPVGAASSSLYPCLWHCFTAMTINAVGCSIPLAVNSANVLFSAVVFPSSMMFLIKNIFSDTRMYVASIAAVVSCGGFPWLFLIFGPLYANLAAFCLLPLVIASFIAVFERKLAFRDRLAWILLFFACSLTVVFSQPNALFTAAVFLASFCVSLIWRSAKFEEKRSCKKRWIFSACFILLVAIVWFCLYKAPFMQSVVQFTWPALFTKAQALINVLSLSFTQMNAAQWMLGIIVICGCLYAFINKQYIWIVTAYLIVAVIYVVNASSDGELKHLLSGFWYTDTYRIGAMAAIFSIPVICMGLVLMYDFIQKIANFYISTLNRKAITPRGLAIVLVCIFLILNYYPNYTNPGNAQVRTAFGSIGEKVATLNSEAVPHMLDPEEMEFAQDVAKLLPDGVKVINSPNDGSVFLYALDGINILYRDLEGDKGSSELMESQLIRSQLKNYAFSAEVEDAVGRFNAKYVLLLDQGDDNAGLRSYLSNYKPEEWSGIESITDTTPGFEVVMARGDMRLYKIVDVAY